MILNQINFRQPKYMIPAIIYFPLLFTAYFLFDMFNTEIAEGDNGLETTEYLNSNLPQTHIKGDGIGNRYENMRRSFGKIQDLSAVDNIDRNEETRYESFQSQYSEEERRLLEEDAARRSEELDRLREMQEAISGGAEKGSGMIGAGESAPLSEEERLLRAQNRQDAAMEELSRVLSEARLGGRRAVEQVRDTVRQAAASVTAPDEPVREDTRVVRSIDEEEKASDVVKIIRESSSYFNTIAENETPPSLIKAIIDEEITAIDGSRVRLRLLDDVQVSDVVIRKGSYVYAIMSGFGSQRVKGAVNSILVSDNLIKVNLSIYDTDGLEGLYVPQSRFRETAKNIGAGAMSGSMNLNSSSSSGDMVKSWGLNALNNAVQKTTNAVSSAIRQNKVRLKYGTQVYLVNGREKRDK